MPTFRGYQNCSVVTYRTMFSLDKACGELDALVSSDAVARAEGGSMRLFGAITILAASLMPLHPVASAASVGTKVKEPVSVRVSREAESWTVTYVLNADTERWVFPVSAVTFAGDQPWRPKQWRVLTRDLELRREGNYDVLRSTNGRPVPRKVRIAITPTSGSLRREYDPAVMLGNGTVALYSEQFDIAPAPAQVGVAAWSPEMSVTDMGGAHAKTVFHDRTGPVFVQGRRQDDPMLQGAETYVIFGGASITEGANVATLAHPELPAWLNTELLSLTPAIAERYAERLGPKIEAGRPLLLLAWRGATKGKVVADGGVRPGQILMTFEGEGLLEPNPKAQARAQWFIAHELSHFWLGSSGVAYSKPGDAWITEGGADMMAISVLKQLKPSFDADGEAQRAVDDCVRFAVKPISSASARNESRAPYACGLVFALAAQGVVQKNGGQDYFDFLKPLLTAHRKDRRLSGAEWLAHLTKMAGNPAPAMAIGKLVNEGANDPGPVIATLFDQTNVAYSRSGSALTLLPGRATKPVASTHAPG